MLYGYLYASSSGNELTEKRLRLIEKGIHQKRLYIDKGNHKYHPRRRYEQLVDILTVRDVLVINTLSDLGKTYQGMLKAWQLITKRIGAKVVVLDMPEINTIEAQTGPIVAQLVARMLTFCDQVGRRERLKRQAEGISAARLRGVHLGRPRIPLPANYETIIARYQQGIISNEVARKQLNNMSKGTFYRTLKRLNGGEQENNGIN